MVEAAVSDVVAEIIEAVRTGGEKVTGVTVAAMHMAGADEIHQECDREASVRIGEVRARQCRIENFEGLARSCDVRLRKYGSRDDALTPAEAG
jgi:hypothetical protein